MSEGREGGRPFDRGAAGARPRAEALLAAAFEASPSGLALLGGPELRFLRVNAAYRALLPAPHVDPVDRAYAEVWAESGARALPRLRGALETGEPWHDDDHAVEAAGLLRRFSLHASRIEADGSPALLLEVWETTPLWEARRIAEDAAASAQRHASELDAVVDAIADGFVLCGPDGEVLRMNEVARRLLGLRPEERALSSRARWGRYAARAPDGTPVAYEESPLARALAGEVVRSAHLRVEAPCVKGWFLASAAPVRAPGGKILGAVLTFSDESALHAVEEARDDLVRMVSHDLRSPLNAILAQAHLLRHAPGQEVEARAASIARSCHRMSAMILDLLDATLLEAGQLRMSTRELDLSDAVEEIVERHRGALPVDRVELGVRGTPPPVAADPVRLERIVVNLLTNALKYSPPQSAVRLEIAQAPGGATLTFADRGVGIAPEDLPHVFERFFRARSVRQPEGLGLGLYITRLLVFAHGGRIEARSSLGQGSTFEVFLPAEAPLRGPPPAT